MSQRELRTLPSIDYKLRGTTGEVRYKARLSRYNVTVIPNQETTMSNSTSSDDVVAALQVLTANINDYIDDNFGIADMAVFDIDMSIEKIQAMRSEFRGLQQSLERLLSAEDYERDY